MRFFVFWAVSYFRLSSCLFIYFSLLFLLLTPQSPLWGAIRHSASQEVSKLLWIAKVYYSNCNSPSLVSVPGETQLRHTHMVCLRFNITLIFESRSPKWFLYFRFSNKSLCAFFIYSRPAQLVSLFISSFFILFPYMSFIFNNLSFFFFPCFVFLFFFFFLLSSFFLLSFLFFLSFSFFVSSFFLYTFILFRFVPFHQF